MAGTFTTDLVQVRAFESITEADEVVTVGTFKAGVADNDDYKIQGTYAYTFGVSSATGVGTCSVLAKTTSPDQNWSGSGYHFFMWIKEIAWPSVADHAKGGVRVSICSNSAPSAVRSLLAATVTAGGTSYALNDTLTLVGGTFSGGAAQVTVTGVSGGAVTSVSPVRTERGRYTILPTNPISTTGGTGSGCTLNAAGTGNPPDGWIYTISEAQTWFVGGPDTVLLEGWMPYVVEVDGTSDLDTGGARISVDAAGTTVTAIAVSKLLHTVIDVCRYGTGLTINDGTAGSPVALEDVRAYDNANARAWGIVTASQGIFYFTGKIRVGTTGQTAITYFKDVNQVCVWMPFPVNSSFYEIVLAGAAGFVTTFQLGNLSGGVASGGVTIRGALRYTHYAAVATGYVPSIWTLTVNAANTLCKLYNCTFSQMKSAVLRGDSEVRFSTFQDSGQITAGGADLRDSTFLDLRATSPISATYAVIVQTSAADLRNCTFTNAASASAEGSAVQWDVAVDPDGKLDGCSFTSGGGAGHAIEFGTNSPTTMTLRNVTFSGYNAANGQTNSTIYVKRTVGTVTINIIGGTTPSYKTDGATVDIVINPVATTITVKDINTGGVISGARVLVTASDNTGPMPFEEVVTSITRSGSTATVTHTTHGLVNGKKVLIKGANQQEYNGIFVLTVIDANSYSYTVSGTPDTPATGTIKATGVVIDGTTDINGVISDTRSHASSQPITGRVRKATGGTIYKTGTISGTISNTSGFSVTVQMIPDA